MGAHRRQLPRSRSFGPDLRVHSDVRRCERLPQTSETGLQQSRHHSSNHNVGLLVSAELHAPTCDAAAALRLDFDHAGVMRYRDARDLAVVIRPLRMVDLVQALDDFLSVERPDLSQLTWSRADQPDAGDEWMPVKIELSDHRPHTIGWRRELDRFGDTLHFRV